MLEEMSQQTLEYPDKRQINTPRREINMPKLTQWPPQAILYGDGGTILHIQNTPRQDYDGFSEDEY